MLLSVDQFFEDVRADTFVQEVRLASLPPFRGGADGLRPLERRNCRPHHLVLGRTESQVRRGVRQDWQGASCVAARVFESLTCFRNSRSTTSRWRCSEDRSSRASARPRRFTSSSRHGARSPITLSSPSLCVPGEISLLGRVSLILSLLSQYRIAYEGTRPDQLTAHI